MPQINLIISKFIYFFLKLKEAAGVEPIKLSSTENDNKIDVVGGTQLQLAGFTENGPAVSKYTALQLSNMV